MPRAPGTGIYVLPPIYLAIPGTTILSTQHNTPLEDIQNTFNLPTPIFAGGTGASTVVGAADSLSTISADIPSASTTDMALATGVNVTVTGNVTINGFGSGTAGTIRRITFSGSPTLTYNVTSLILPTRSDIPIQPGDNIVAECLGSGNWRVTDFQSINATANKLIFIDPGATPGPVYDAFRDSSSPAASDALSRTIQSGRTSTAAKVNYTTQQTYISDPTNATAAGFYQINALIAGVETRIAIFGPNLIAKGTITNDSAAAGDIGEYQESTVTVASAAVLTTATAINMTSLNLTAGDWEVRGAGTFATQSGTPTLTYSETSISLISATRSTRGINGMVGESAQTSSPDRTMNTGPRRISLAAPATVYLVVYGVFTGGGVSSYGQISARRIR